MSGLISGILTALLIIIFIGIWAWAWSSKNKEIFDSMAQLPLEDQPQESEESDHD